MVPHARFTELLAEIEPSATTKANASSAHTGIRNYLWNHPTFKSRMVHDYLSGSYRRDTAIRPRIKDGKLTRPDVDIIVVTNHTMDDSPAAVVNELFWSLNKEYEVWRQGRSVGVKTPLVDMDVVPIIDIDGSGTLYIPDRKLERWIRTNPPGHTTWTIDVNRQTGGRFKPLVKMMKWWRRTNPTISKRPKGFVVECFTAKHMSAIEEHYGELFVGTLEAIVEEYQWHAYASQVPGLDDPGVPGHSVTLGMTTDAFVGFYNKAKEHAKLGRSALREPDLEKATEIWRVIFGPRFRATQARSVGLLRDATGASGALTFPDRKTGPVKPAGFA